VEVVAAAAVWGRDFDAGAPAANPTLGRATFSISAIIICMYALLMLASYLFCRLMLWSSPNLLNGQNFVHGGIDLVQFLQQFLRVTKN
jgi:hypothetical protein